MTDSDRLALRRRHDPPDLTAVPAPFAHWRPKTLAELIDAVRAAEAQLATTRRPDPSLTHVALLPPDTGIRAYGSAWALSDAAVPAEVAGAGGHVIDTSRLNRTITSVLGAALTPNARAALLGQSPDPARALDRWNYVHVEAGVKVHDLYARLDDDRLRFHGLDAAGLLAGPWALPTAGNAGAQSIVGAFSTGTHGGDVALPPVADVVQAIHLVGAGGRQYWIEPSATSPAHGFGDAGEFHTADAPLRDAIRAATGVTDDLVIVRDPTTFRAAMMGVGRLGVIYAVVLKVVRQYGLVEERVRMAWSDARRRLLNPADPWFGRAGTPGERNHHLQVVVNPHPRAGEAEHSCWVTTRRKVPVADVLGADGAPIGRAARRGDRVGGPDDAPVYARAGNSPTLGAEPFQTLICGLRTSAEIVVPVMGAVELLKAVAVAVLGPFSIPVVVGLTIMQGGLLANLLAVGPTASLGDYVASALNWAVENGAGALVPVINEVFLSAGQSEHRGDAAVRAISYALLDGYDYTDRNCLTQAASGEFMFDATDPRARAASYVEFVDRAFARVRELQDGTLDVDGRRVPGPRAFGGYISMRFTAATAALIGPQRWATTCNMEVSGLGGLRGSPLLLQRLQQDAVGAFGAAVHWGQFNTLVRSQVDTIYPNVAAWRATLRNLSAGRPFDPFSTPFSRRCGLEA